MYYLWTICNCICSIILNPVWWQVVYLVLLLDIGSVIIEAWNVCCINHGVFTSIFTMEPLYESYINFIWLPSMAGNDLTSSCVLIIKLGTVLLGTWYCQCHNLIVCLVKPGLFSYLLHQRRSHTEPKWIIIMIIMISLWTIQKSD